jgi:hypothetical protein|tara:strand:+ start:50 stop:268 length:219 start_codon:yes stop_codon:yes gene_type:complete
MKETTLLNMKHDMGKLAEGLHNTMNGMNHVHTLTQGLLETVRRMPGYETAIEELLKDEKKALEEQEKSKLEL